MGGSIAAKATEELLKLPLANIIQGYNKIILLFQNRFDSCGCS